jgi:hypothetical protein
MLINRFSYMLFFSSDLSFAIQYCRVLKLTVIPASKKEEQVPLFHMICSLFLLRFFAVLWIGRHRFDGNPYPDPTFYFDADSYPNPTPSFVGKSDFCSNLFNLLNRIEMNFISSSASYHCFILLISIIGAIIFDILV